MSSEVGVVAALCALLAVFCPEADAITGGSPVPIESFPYQVAIDQFRNQSCGGALIGKKTVITTASCFHRREIDVSDVTVRLGSATRTGGLSLGVDDFLQHPDVDAVLLYLDQRVTPRKEIKFVPVPTVPTAIRQGELVTISGYGDVSCLIAHPQVYVICNDDFEVEKFKGYFCFQGRVEGGCTSGHGRGGVQGRVLLLGQHEGVRRGLDGRYVWPERRRKPAGQLAGRAGGSGCAEPRLRTAWLPHRVCRPHRCRRPHLDRGQHGHEDGRDASAAPVVSLAGDCVMFHLS
ncbi:trypsin-1-like isoform X1 [Frankliniella occidentalis]|uniref:Trypsin-1-like isoform X1 n=1 Tax=Frankliniella occidentalis TaxID=133901 RepID=A0A9C6U6E6_FRAOC|nr:trypsin-1-like isoform X1 [Frankliniella occidentalis]